MVVLMILAILALLFVAGVTPNRSKLSEFELQRRLDDKLSGSLLEWRRGDLYAEVMTIRRVLIAFLLVLASALAIAEYGWLWGLLGSLALILLYNRLAAVKFVHTSAQRQYDRHEKAFLRWLDQNRKFIRPFRGVADTGYNQELASREELAHLVDQAHGLISPDERKMIHGALDFKDKRIKDYMTPRSVMEVIGAHELLGPLVLNDLHKTGHSHFPVLDGDIDHIVGILHLHNLLTITKKESVTVKEIMEPKVLFIHEDQTLADALSACIKHRRHLLVVINEFRETVGVVTIEDAVEQLIGKQIVDENDNHEDLRAVAARNPRDNNKSSKASDV